MHVVFTPSWYPDRNRPHNGSFFRDQARMLQRSGMRVGVIALEPVSFWQARRELTVDVEEGIVVVRGTVPTIPKGVLPGDRMVARAVAARAVRLYEETIRSLPESSSSGGESRFPTLFTPTRCSPASTSAATPPSAGAPHWPSPSTVPARRTAVCMGGGTGLCGATCDVPQGAPLSPPPSRRS